MQDYAIFIVDPRGHIASWNTGAERLYGYTQEEVLGKHFSVLFPEEDRRRHHPEAELTFAREQGRYEEEGWRRRKDSDLFCAHVVIAVMRDVAGRLVGFGKVTRDITETKRREAQERELQREQAARADAEAANRAKSDFLAVLSHELRSPLTAMLSYTDLLLSGIPERLPEASKKQVERIRAATQHLRHLIDGLLTFSRIQAGQEEVQPETLDLNELIRESTDLAESLVRKKGLEFAVHTAGDSAIVHADPTKLRQIVWNLLSNAVKFTEKGTVSLAAETTREELVVEVRDTGPGIPAEDLERIFEPFRQADNGVARQGGTGLGLNVTKRLSELMGGTIDVQSTVGEGSTFRVRLPRGVDADDLEGGIQANRGDE